MKLSVLFLSALVAVAVVARPQDDAVTDASISSSSSSSSTSSTSSTSSSTSTTSTTTEYPTTTEEDNYYPSGQCKARPRVSFVYDGHPWYRPEVLFTNECDDYWTGNYYVFKDYSRFGCVVIDLGCPQQLTKIFLKNSNNAFIDNRGTREFTVDFSEDGDHWENNVVVGELTSPANKFCSVPLEEFRVVPSTLRTRYLRITARSFFGYGAALQHITWETNDN